MTDPTTDRFAGLSYRELFGRLIEADDAREAAQTRLSELNGLAGDLREALARRVAREPANSTIIIAIGEDRWALWATHCYGEDPRLSIRRIVEHEG